MTLRVSLAAGGAALALSGLLVWGGAQAVAAAASARNVGWETYGGSAAGQRYSTLTQLNPANVGGLKEAWRADAGVGALQTSPIVVGRVLYGYTTSQQVIAIDGATGKRLWTFDSGVNGTQPARGLTYWTNGREKRLLAGVMNDLYALDPDTGRVIPGFGEGGKVNLREGLGRDPATITTYLTSPGVLYGDSLIVGFRTSESAPAAPGAIRAIDVRTGKVRWTFNTIPRTGEPGAETWPADAWKTAGAANNWPGLVIDAKRGIVFAPTGSPVDDFYGADRPGDNLYANSLLALDAKTGRRLWHFQAVHHDIWDRDFPSAPVLLTVKRGGKTIDAVAQTTKQGFVFVFDRVTGKPLFPIEERPFPKSETPGEWTAPTQPIPTAPAPYARQRLTEDMLTKRTPEAHAWAVEQFKTFKSDGQFVPLAVGRPTVVFPGFDGGAEWGGPAVDPQRGVIFVNANDIAWTGSLAAAATAVGRGASLYQAQCASCHGLDRAGSPPAFPSLQNLEGRMSAPEVSAVIANGRGRMPAFPAITGADRDALIAYVRTGKAEAEASDRNEVTSGQAPRSAYRFTGYRKFYDRDGYPAVEPPWGTLNAIDLNTGKYLWKVPLGEYPELAAKGLKDTGTENYGGPLVTSTGVLFIGATIFDRKFRAFDSRTGKLLWTGELPFAGNASPITYMIDGVQYVAIATSNGKNRAAPQGSAYVAFALPR